MRRRSLCPTILVLTFVLCLTGLSEGTLFAAPPPVPHVRFDQTISPPDVPPTVLIGENFTFRVRLKNTGGSIGFGPFIDLVLDAGGANLSKPCPCDGMTFVSASMIGINGPSLPLVSSFITAPCVPSTTPVTLVHPFQQTSEVQAVSVPAGSQLVTITLPFGSFDPTQPEIVVQVTAHVSNLADVSPIHPFRIYARGGFRYGSLTPIDDPATDCPVLSDINGSSTPPCNNQITDATLWFAQEQTNPAVMIVSKTYLGPENETATGPNFLQKYQITVDIAAGQTINNLKVTDRLPNNMAFHHLVSSSPACLIVVNPALPVPDIAHNTPDNDLILQCSSVTGVLGPDASVVFDFFIPMNDANGAPVLSSDGTPVPVVNTVTAEGDWSSLDPCDGSGHIVSTMTPAPPLLAKSIAIQKSVFVVNDTGTGGPTPGDTLQYTLAFQLSDFRTAGSLRIQDIFSDGQTLVPGSIAFAVTDQCGTTSAASISIDGSPSLLSCLAPGTLSPLNQLSIDLSAAMSAVATVNSGPQRHQHGILTGGYSFAAPNVGATGTITFRTVIDDAYHCPVGSSHDLFVDKDDPLTNTVTLTSTILTNGGSCATIPVSGFVPTFAHDDSGTLVVIVTDVLAKSVYAVRRGSVEICGPHTTPCPSKPDVIPNDDVTFRLAKTIPSTDAENMTIQDWLPLPTFSVAGSTFTNALCTVGFSTGLPASGKACLGPANTLLPPFIAGTLPTYSADPVTNSISFGYGTFFDSSNQPHTIDLLFTGKVTNVPSADGLFTTNEAQECEGNTFGGVFCQAAVAQIHVREPVLRITKGVVAANNPNAAFSASFPVTFSIPPLQGTTGACPRFSGGTITTGLGSNVSNVDANDRITFAIVVENTGGSAAYDIRLHDLFPTDPTSGAMSCFIPDFPTLCVTDGTGAHLAATSTASPGTLTISLPNPLPAQTTPGSNVVVLTFDATIVGDIKPGCCENRAFLDAYSSTPAGDEGSGPNFVTAGLGGPFLGVAEVCVLPKGTKSIKSTSEPHTLPSSGSSPEPLAIGEIIRYHLEVVVPESTAASTYQVQDILPAGLSYQPGTVITTISPGITAANVSPSVAFSAGCGSSVTFNFGIVTNNNNNSAPELIVLEFDALVCNINTNQNGTALDNHFIVIVTPPQGSAQQVTSNTVPAKVVEPKLTITKTATVPSLTVGATATYTITLANNAPAATATAFDIQLTDQLPLCLKNLTAVQITSSGGVTGITNNSTTAVNVGIVSIPINGTVTVQYTATVNCVTCSDLINAANVTWTSLPGLGTTPNATASSTPGASGDPNGERNGSQGAAGPANHYAASASAPLCCMAVSVDNSSCAPKDGTYAYTFNVTNLTGEAMAVVTFSPITPNVTMTPSGVITFGSLLNSGSSTTVAESIGGPGAVAGATVCFAVSLGYLPYACSTTQCVTLQQCCATPPPNMIAWYPLDEAAGATTVADISGNSHNGTAHPGANPSHTPTVSPAAVVGGSLYFVTGSFFYVQVPDTPPLSLDIGIGDFAIDAWVYSYNDAPIVDKFDASTHTGYKFYLAAPFSAAGQTLYFSYADGVNTYTASASAPVPYVGWHHVAVTLQRSATSPYVRVVFYVDGAQQGGQSVTVPVGNIANTLDLFIGGSHPVDAAAHETAIDEVELFNRALSQTEIQSIVNAGSFGKCKTCSVVSNETVNCGPNGTSTYTFTVTNLSPTTYSAVSVQAPAGVTITPASIPMSLPPGASAPVTVTISGATPGTTLCLSVLLVQIGGSSCSTQHCISLPNCCYPPPSGMVSWWRANGDASDVIGGNNGTLQGQAAFASGMVGQAFSFGATGDFVSVPNTSNLNFGAAGFGGDLSIDAWIKTSSTASLLPIVDKRDLSSGSQSFGYSLFLLNGKLAFQLGDGTFLNYLSSGPDLRDGLFHHVAVSVDRTSPTGGSLYVNGAVVLVFDPTSHPGSLTNNKSLLIGQQAGASPVNFIGLIDEVEIFKRALTQTEIQGISNAGASGKCFSGFKRRAVKH